MSNHWIPAPMKPSSFSRRKQHHRDGRKARRHVIETLEIRTLLAGSCFVDIVGKDLVIQCDASDNGIKVTQEAPGSYRVTGLDRGAGGTSVNGSIPNGSYLATIDDRDRRVRRGRGSDIEIDMTQGGDDLLQIIGPLDVPDDLAVALSNGDVLIDGTSGVVQVRDETAITGGTGSDDNIEIFNEVKFNDDVTLTAGGDVSIFSDGTSTGPVFEDDVEIVAAGNVYIDSYGTSTGPVFEDEVEIVAGFNMRITNNTLSTGTGPIFADNVDILMSGSDGILKISDSTFRGDFEADGGDGTNTFVDGGGNTILGDLDLENFLP